MPASKPCPQTVISFDVGVRNLSYCMFNRKCSDTMELVDSGEEESGPEEKEEASSIYDYETSNLAQAISSYSVQDWECVDILTECGSKAEKVYSVKCGILVKYLIKCLHNKFSRDLINGKSHGTSTAIVVEEQPNARRGTKGSMRMKVLSYAIVSYFETMAICENLQMTICMMSAKKKLLLCDQLKVPAEKPILKTRKVLKSGQTVSTKVSKQRIRGKMYRNNKWRAVEGCKIAMDMGSIVTENDKNIFKNSKKKDDIADAFLQGLWYCAHGSVTHK